MSNDLLKQNNIETARLTYVLHLADSALILAQRNAEWCGHGPVLEQDIAITNISLDLIGQARNFYQYAAMLSGNGVTEDQLAFLRGEREFRNYLLVELPRGDWAFTIVRQFLYSAYQFFLFTELRRSGDSQIAAIAEKSLKEVTYHLRWSSEWVIRMGDATEESHSRMQLAVNNSWSYTGEFFTASSYEQEVSAREITIPAKEIKISWDQRVLAILSEATLSIPKDCWMQTGGKEGRHTEQLGYVLAEMQYLQRAYPGSEW